MKVAGRVGTQKTGGAVRIGWRCIPYIYIYYIRRHQDRTPDDTRDKPSTRISGHEMAVANIETEPLYIKKTGVTMAMWFLRFELKENRLATRLLGFAKYPGSVFMGSFFFIKSFGKKETG